MKPNKYIKYILIFIFLSGIIGIRLFEKNFFDDGLINFFEFSYQTEPLPTVDFFNVWEIDSFRFWLNSFLSIGILTVLFKEIKLMKFLFGLYFLSFLLISFIFFIAWKNYEAGNYLSLFYTRRLLIQPVLLFILLPALLYHQKNKS